MQRVLLVLSLFLSTAGARAGTRVALVGTDSSDQVQNVLALAEAKLSEEKGIELLERRAIDKVLAEQKLAMGGLIDGNQAVAVGNLLSVDLFAVLETEPRTKEALAFVVFDARNGVRLWDNVLPAGALERTIEAMAAGVQAAVRKQSVEAKGLRTVGLLTVRNADLPREMDSFADAVGLMLERGLVASADVAVLERERLAQVNQERALPKPNAGDSLRASLVLMELDIGRPRQGSGLHAALILTDSKSRQLGKVTVDVGEVNAAMAADALLPEVLKTLEAAQPGAISDRRREGKRYGNEARLQMAHHQFREAVRAAEAALAMDPQSLHELTLLTESLYQYAIVLVDPYDRTSAVRDMAHPLPVDPEKLKTSLRLVHRAMDLGARILQRLPSASAEVLTTHLLDFEVARSLPAQYAMQLLAYRVRAPDAESKRLLESFHEEAFRSMLETNAIAARAARAEPMMFEYYTKDVHLLVIQSLPVNATDAASYVRRAASVVESWLDISRRPQNRQALDATLADDFLLRLMVPEDPFNGRWRLGRPEYVRMDALFESMERHPHPLLRLYGQTGRTWVAKQLGQLTQADALERFSQIKKEAFDLIRQPGPGNADALRIACYKLLQDLALRMWAGDSERVCHAYAEIWDFMISRHELIEQVVDRVLTCGPGEKGARKKIELADRTLALLDSPVCRLFHGQKQPLKARLHHVRNWLLVLNPELNSQRADAPWTHVVTLLDIQRLPHAEALVALAVSDNKAYAVIGGNDPLNGKYLEVYRVDMDSQAQQSVGRTFIKRDLPVGQGQASFGWKMFVHCSCLTGSHFYVGTVAGIFDFPLKAGEVHHIGEADGLPSASVGCLAFAAGKLYAALDGKYLAAFDPETKHCDVLSSCLRKDKRSPFDDGPPFSVSYMIGDLPRQRLLFLARRPLGQEPATGLWEFDIRRGSFRYLLPLYLNLAWGRSEPDGRILIATGSYSVLAFDPARDQAEWIWRQTKSKTAPSEPAALLRGTYEIAAPYLYRDGELWTGVPFGRILLGDGKQEFFPPYCDKRANCASAALLEPAGAGPRIVVGNMEGLWLLELLEKGGLR